MNKESEYYKSIAVDDKTNSLSIYKLDTRTKNNLNCKYILLISFTYYKCKFERKSYKGKDRSNNQY